ncbi:MAG: hypothetical protein AMXMBFR84_51220 [Candidatus Hydrogenedentota bacterium]
MGYPPIQEHAKTTTLLLALLLGGCIPSASIPKPYGDEDLRALNTPAPDLDVNGCGTLHVTSSLIAFISQSPTLSGRDGTATLFIAPNGTMEAATFVKGNCRYVARTLVARETVAFEGVPAGEYFLVLDDAPPTAVRTGLSFQILNERGKLHVRWIDVIDNNVVVAMTIEAS